MSAINKITVNNELKGSFDLLIIGVDDNKKLSFPANLSAKIKDDLSAAFMIEGKMSKKSKKIISYDNGKITRTCLYGFAPKKDTDTFRSLAANIIKYSKSFKDLAIDLNSFAIKSDKQLQAFVEGLVLGTYEFLNYKDKEKGHKLSSITLIGDPSKSIVDKATIIANGVCYARDISNHPPNILTPTYIANDAVQIAKSNKNMSSKIIDVSEFEALGLGSFYGVAMGAHEPAKLILVEYKGGKKNDKPIALVGKGLTFDSGGISIKPSSKMDEMKFDMCGSSVVMGVLKAVAELNPKLNIVFAIGSTENMPGGKAQRPGDIVTAYNGKTIEVLNTDAEGRLVLADVLSYVVKNYNPREILDFATLTGAVLVALGDRASGLMGNDPKILKKVKKASDKTGERVWELPMWKEYSKDITIAWYKDAILEAKKAFELIPTDENRMLIGLIQNKVKY